MGWRLGSRPGIRHAVAETEMTAEDDELRKKSVGFID